MEFPITREQFAAWLAQKLDGETVGYTCETGNCPIATACTVLSGVATDVSILHWWLSTHICNSYTTPKWVQVFIMTLDNTAPVDSHGMSTSIPVSARTARRILSEAA